tara:strand:- start:274 stop:396 length:123 start_codon:yes stop_codon:yes gene_type:complete
MEDRAILGEVQKQISCLVHEKKIIINNKKNGHEAVVQEKK